MLFPYASILSDVGWRADLSPIILSNVVEFIKFTSAPVSASSRTVGHFSSEFLTFLKSVPMGNWMSVFIPISFLWHGPCVCGYTQGLHAHWSNPVQNQWKSLEHWPGGLTSSYKLSHNVPWFHSPYTWLPQLYRGWPLWCLTFPHLQTDVSG